ncbi:MAG TPA: alpha/beta fold hydrolase [Puia sp.]|jgi:pimeloyl-ACP methyl ester carboxylesterase/ribosomal protein S18 acetylase RimI-like enzyme|nr:alpha/beta fold hydrolase [Puia sp.]
MEIRPAKFEDADDLVKLVNSAYRGEGGWTGEGHLIGGPRTRVVDVEELLREPDGVVLTGWEGGELAGCVHLKKVGEKLYLGMLSVWPAKQGMGVGKVLMSAAAEYARKQGCKAIRITVITVRDELIAWYERQGFRRTGEVEPFHAGDRFGTQKVRLELAVLEKWSDGELTGVGKKTVVTGYAPVNGLQMYYEIHGDGGMPLVMIHGGGSTIESTFSYLLPLLSRHRRIIAVELQAHGRTSDREGPETFQQDADDVAALLSYLKVGKADVLGFSNGGTTTLKLAIRHPALVNRIVAVSGAYRRDGFVAGFFDGFPGATLEVMPAVLHEAYLKVAPDKSKLAVMFEKDKQRMMDFEDWSDDELRGIRAPAMIVSSDRDVVTVEHAARMGRMIPGAQLVILPGRHGSVIGTIEAGVGKGYAEIVAGLVGEFLDGK